MLYKREKLKRKKKERETPLKHKTKKKDHQTLQNNTHKKGKHV